MKVFIGYDPRQPVAYQVAAHSIWKNASRPISITRLDLSKLPIKRRGLTEFTFSRFLVPFLSDFEGKSLFIDSDFLCLGDVWELDAMISEMPVAVAMVKHPNRMFENASLMVFHNKACRILTPEYIDDPKNKLFDFSWAKYMGNIPNEWNHLVGYDEPNPDAKMIHFTQGIPCWPETKNCAFSDVWRETLKESVSTVSYDGLMKNSVHDQFVQRGRQPQEGVNV